MAGGPSRPFDIASRLPAIFAIYIPTSHPNKRPHPHTSLSCPNDGLHPKSGWAVSYIRHRVLAIVSNPHPNAASQQLSPFQRLPLPKGRLTYHSTHLLGPGHSRTERSKSLLVESNGSRLSEGMESPDFRQVRSSALYRIFALSQRLIGLPLAYGSSGDGEFNHLATCWNAISP